MQQELIELLEEEIVALMSKRDQALGAGKQHKFIEFVYMIAGMQLAIDVIRGLRMNWGVKNEY